MSRDEYYQYYVKRVMVYNKTKGNVNTNYLRMVPKLLKITYHGFLTRKLDIFEEEIQMAQEAIYVTLFF